MGETDQQHSTGPQPAAVSAGAGAAAVAGEGGRAVDTRPAAGSPQPVANGDRRSGPGAPRMRETTRPVAPDPLPAAGARPARRTRRGNRPGRVRGPNGWRSPDVRGGFLIGALNIQSMKPKLLELCHELCKRRYDLLSVTETWLKPSTPNRLLSFPGYRIFRADRPDKSGYGGVAVLCRNAIDASVIAVPPAANPSSKMESLWLSVGSGRRGHQFVLAAVYRPPRRTVAALEADFETLETQLQHVMIEFPGSKVVINGDLNCNILADSPDSSRQTLVNFLSIYSMSQLIAEPTYATGSLLDVIIVNDSDIIRKCGTRVCDISPHKYVVAALTIPRPRAKPAVVNCRPLNRVNVTELHASLHRADWQTVYREGRCSDQWQRFLDIFLPILDRFAPMKRIAIRSPDAGVSFYKNDW